MPGLIGHLHVHQDITGKKFSLALTLLTGTHLNNLFSGHQHLTEFVFHAKSFYPFKQRALYLHLETGIGMYHIPSFRHHQPPVSARKIVLNIMSNNQSTMPMINTTTNTIRVVCTVS